MTNSKLDKNFLLWSGKPELFSSLTTLLTQDGWHVETIKESQVLEKYNNTQSACLAILSPLDHMFSLVDIGKLDRFYASGNSLVVASGDDESASESSNLNDITSRFGVKFCHNCVIRPNPCMQYHPKEAQLEDFIVNRGLNDVLRKYIQNEPTVYDSPTSCSNLELGASSRILYVRGCTLKVHKVSTIVMTSSRWAIPSQQPICSFHRDEKKNSRMIAIGSSLMMSNQYINEAHNRALVRALIEFIINESFPINISDARTVEIPDLFWPPEINQLADVPISCLQESETLPEDKTSLINKRLFNIENSMVPTIGRAYKDLGVDYEPLTLIKPHFGRLHINFEPATHGFLLQRSKFKADAI